MAYDDLPSLPPVQHDPSETLAPSAELETRNILDSNHIIVGQLSLPVGTAEAIWTAKITAYSQLVVNIIGDIIGTISLNSANQTTTSSATASVIGGMTATPDPGKYVALFSGSIFTGGASAVGEFGVYVDGVLLPETRRDISCNLQLLGGLVTVSLNSIGVGTYTGTQVTLNGTNTIDIRFKSTNGGTIGFKERVFTLIKVR